MATNNAKELIAFVDKQLVARSDQMEAVLKGSGISAEKFRYMATQQLVRKPDLMPVVQKNPGSFISSVMEAAEQGLDFSKPNEAHLVPIPGNAEKNRPDSIVLFRGYKGIAKMAKRSPGVADIDVQVVHAKDKYLRKLGSKRELIHEPPPFGQDRGAIIGFYAVAFLVGAPPIFDEMTVDDTERHAKRFIKARNGPFTGVKNSGRQDPNFIAYGLKTVLVRLCYRKLDLSSEIGMALQQEHDAEPVEANDQAAAGSSIECEYEDVSDQIAARKEELKKQAATVKQPSEPMTDDKGQPLADCPPFDSPEFAAQQQSKTGVAS
jgi:recombination protein RecT